jgi:hypothetical protein
MRAVVVKAVAIAAVLAAALPVEITVAVTEDGLGAVSSPHVLAAAATWSP